MKDQVLESLIFQKASIIASGAVIETDLESLSRIAISMALLSIASNMDSTGKAARLINIASSVVK